MSEGFIQDAHMIACLHFTAWHVDTAWPECSRVVQGFRAEYIMLTLRQWGIHCLGLLLELFMVFVASFHKLLDVRRIV